MKKKTSLSAYNAQEIPSAEHMKIGIVVADWNDEITYSLRDAALETLEKHGAIDDNIEIVHVPGSYELPMGARILLGSDKFDAIICLGCVIKGETPHNDYINNAVSRGLTTLSLTSGTPCIFGVLTPNNEAQAKARAGGDHGNKGVEAAVTAIKMADLAQKHKSQKSKIGFS